MHNKEGHGHRWSEGVMVHESFKSSEILCAHMPFFYKPCHICIVWSPMQSKGIQKYFIGVIYLLILEENTSNLGITLVWGHFWY